MIIEKIIVSELALSDLEEIWLYIGIDNPSAVDDLVERIYTDCETLQQYPDLGRKRDEVLPGMRSLAIEKYVVYYRLNDTVLEIVRILSGFRDVDSIF